MNFTTTVKTETVLRVTPQELEELLAGVALEQDGVTLRLEVQEEEGEGEVVRLGSLKEHLNAQ